MAETSQPFEVAVAVTRAGKLFTTHMAVPAGCDRCAPNVFLNDLDPDMVRVELHGNGVGGGLPERQEMKRVRPLPDTSGAHVCTAALSAVRPSTDYTVCVIPQYPNVAVPLEAVRILWQR